MWRMSHFKSRGLLLIWLGVSLLLFSTNGYATETLHYSFMADHMVLDSVYANGRGYAGTQVSTVNVFDLKTKQQLYTLQLPKHADSWNDKPAPLISLDISPNQQLLAASSDQGVIFIYDLSTQKLSNTLTFAGLDLLTAIRFVNDDSLLVGSLGGEVFRINLQGKQHYFQEVEYAPINRIELSPSEKQFAVATDSSILHTFETNSGKKIQELTGHKDAIRSLAFIDENQLVSSGNDRRLLVWDLMNGEFKELYRSSEAINALAFDPIRKQIALPIENHQIALMQWPGKTIASILPGHKGFITALRFIEKSEYLMSSGSDSKMVFWRIP